MNKNHTVAAFFLALLITAVWTFCNKYEYVSNNIFLFNRINVFPLVLWTIGLTLLYIVHTKFKTHYPLFHITIFYLVSVFVIEAIGYHLLNIHLNSNYPSLFNLGIIHAPVHMKIFYIIIGPVYIVLTDYLFKRIFKD